MFQIDRTKVSPLVLTSKKTLRDYALLANAKNYPNITPRDDPEAMLLAHRLYEGPESDMYDYLDNTKSTLFDHLSASENTAFAIQGPNINGNNGNSIEWGCGGRYQSVFGLPALTTLQPAQV